MSFLDKFTLPTLLRHAFSKYPNKKAFSFINGKQNTYADLKRSVDEVGILLKSLKIRKGNKVALLAHNSPEWVATYLAIGAMGAVVVPILPDFSKKEIEHILKHSESKALFVSQKLQDKLKNPSIPVIKVEDLSFISGEEPKKVDGEFKYTKLNEDDLLSIIYTSGTTGFSKGVMLSHKNIIYNVYQALKMQKVNSNDRFLSILPLSHTFENTLGMMLPIACGSSVYYLDKLPTPSVLLPAMEKIRPSLMLLVPLVIEKIYKGKILKQINSNEFTKKLYTFRPTQKILNFIAGKKLYKAFGGKLKFFGIGGAKLDGVVEQFLLDCGFPYSIGYGMSETSPVISGAFGKNRKVGSAGVAVESLQIRLHKENHDDLVGEVQVKGPNVMKGYYKADDANKEVFTDDGWLRTGDLGEFDERGHLSIKGRIKTMILGSSGENIYPEEIESVINQHDFVAESLVTKQGEKLVAMVHINMDELEEQMKSMQKSVQKNMDELKDEAIHYSDEAKKYLEEKAEEMLKEIKNMANKDLNKFSQIQQVILQKAPFLKTPTHKIKRFLYDEDKKDEIAKEEEKKEEGGK